MHYKSTKTSIDLLSLFTWAILTSTLAKQVSIYPFKKTFLTHKLSRFPALKRALLAIGGTLRKSKLGRVDMVLVREAAVNWLTGNLLVPLAICAGDGHRWSWLQLINSENESKNHYIWKQSLINGSLLIMMMIPQVFNSFLDSHVHNFCTSQLDARNPLCWSEAKIEIGRLRQERHPVSNLCQDKWVDLIPCCGNPVTGAVEKTATILVSISFLTWVRSFDWHNHGAFAKLSVGLGGCHNLWPH